jgi:ArsR family transcriptional regulator
MNIQLERFFYLLSDQTRVRCLSLLYFKGELCVCELTQTLKMLQPKISRHLALMKNAGLIIDRRVGQWTYYKIHPKLPSWMNHVLELTCNECVKINPYSADNEKFVKALKDESKCLI